MGTPPENENEDQRQSLLTSEKASSSSNYDSTGRGNESGGSCDEDFDIGATDRLSNIHQHVMKENGNERNNHKASMLDNVHENRNFAGFVTQKPTHIHEDDENDEDALDDNNRNVCCAWRKSIKRDAVHFGVRLSTLLTCASLFVLIHNPFDDAKGKVGLWPSGGWVYITTLMVCWFPQGDAASIIEKSMQRCMGTITGGFLGLLCGFISLELQLNDPYHSLFLGCCIALVTYSVGFFSCQVQLSRKSRFIDQYSYASSLCLLTFSIAIFPFIENYTTGQWKKATFRVINVFIGCIIGTVGSMVVLPKSTTYMLHEQIKKQCKLAGEASEAVLHTSAEVFSGEVQPMGFLGELLLSMRGGTRPNARLAVLRKTYARINKDILEEEGDVALEKYEAAIGAWKVTKGLFSKFRFDPFHCRVPSKQKQVFQKKCASALARALRIQTTVVLLDGIIRNDPRHDYFTKEVVTLFAEIGTLIRKMLTVPLQKETSKLAKDQLVEKVAFLRRGIMRLCSKVAEQPIGATVEFMNDDDDDTLYDEDEDEVAHVGDGAMSLSYGGNLSRRSGAPDSRRGSITFDDSNVYSLLFLQLVEHLTLRCCSLYDAWIKVEEAAIPLHKHA